MPSLAPLPKFRFFSSGGIGLPVVPLVAGRVYFYEAGTTTPKDTYTDATGLVKNTNPVILNARGEADIWLGDGAYKMVVTDALGVQQGGTVDGIEGMAALRAYVDDLRQDLNDAAGGNFTYALGGYTYLYGDGVADNSGQIAAVNAAGKPLFVIGTLRINAPQTLTVPVVDTIRRTFTDSSRITIDNGLPVRPEWFGPEGNDVGMIRRAVDALPITGGVVQLRVATYRSGYETALPSYFDNRGGTPGFDYMTKPRVRIQGSRLPSFNLSNSALVDGSIIRGTMYVASEATGFQADLIGVDVGTAVLAEFYGGVDHDVFCILQVNKAAPVYGNYVRIGSVVALGPGGTTLGHGFLLESINGGSVDYVEARLSYHGCVIKSQNIKCGTLAGTLNTGEEVLVKSDSYALMSNVVIDKAICTGDTSGMTSGYGFQVLADANNGGEVSVGQVVVDNHTIGAALIANGTNTLADVQIGEMIIRSCPTGYRLTGANLRRTNVTRALINNFTSAVVVDAAVTSKDHGVDSLNMAVGTYGVDASGLIRVGDVYAEQITQFALYHRTAAARIYHAGGYTAGAAVANFWAATPALAGTWANVASNDSYSMGSLAGLVRMAGLITGGGSTTICTLPANIRPGSNLRFPCLAYNGTTWTVVELLIVASTGVVSISALAPASNYLSLRGVAWEIPF